MEKDLSFHVISVILHDQQVGGVNDFDLLPGADSESRRPNEYELISRRDTLRLCALGSSSQRSCSFLSPKNVDHLTYTALSILSMSAPW